MIASAILELTHGQCTGTLSGYACDADQRFNVLVACVRHCRQSGGNWRRRNPALHTCGASWPLHRGSQPFLHQPLRKWEHCPLSWDRALNATTRCRCASQLFSSRWRMRRRPRWFQQEEALAWLPLRPAKQEKLLRRRQLRLRVACRTRQRQNFYLIRNNHSNRLS